MIVYKWIRYNELLIIHIVHTEHSLQIYLYVYNYIYIIYIYITNNKI